jgi:hypothetical protein
VAKTAAAKAAPAAKPAPAAAKKTPCPTFATDSGALPALA